MGSEYSRDHAVTVRAGRPYGILFEDRAYSVRILAVMDLHRDLNCRVHRLRGCLPNGVRGCCETSGFCFGRFVRRLGNGSSVF